MSGSFELFMGLSFTSVRHTIETQHTAVQAANTVPQPC
jgi:hypothetical protein